MSEAAVASPPMRREILIDRHLDGPAEGIFAVPVAGAAIDLTFQRQLTKAFNSMLDRSAELARTGAQGAE